MKGTITVQTESRGAGLSQASHEPLDEVKRGVMKLQSWTTMVDRCGEMSGVSRTGEMKFAGWGCEGRRDDVQSTGRGSGQDFRLAPSGGV